MSLLAILLAMAELSVMKTGIGSVTSDPPGIDCGKVCVQSFPAGTQVALKASSPASWNGCDTVVGGVCQVVMKEARTVSATFAVPRFTVTVAKLGTGSGVVTLTPAGNTYDAGSSVTLTAVPDTGSIFDAWSGCDSVIGNSCTVSMDSTRIITASFRRLYFTLTVGDDAGGTVTSSSGGIYCGSACTALYASGTSVTLTATPRIAFRAWTGCDMPAGTTCTVVMTANKTVRPIYGSTMALTVAKLGTGSGVVISEAAGIYCGATCSATYETGSSVTLTAVPNTGSLLDAWSGCDSVLGNTCTVSLHSTRIITASFRRLTFTLTVAADPGGTVTSSSGGIYCGSSCSALYLSGTSVTLTATPRTGFAFRTWTGCDTPSGATCTVVMNANKTVRALY